MTLNNAILKMTIILFSPPLRNVTVHFFVIQKSSRRPYSRRPEKYFILRQYPTDNTRRRNEFYARRHTLYLWLLVGLARRR